MNKKTKHEPLILIRGLFKLLVVHSFLVIYIVVGGYIVIDLFIIKKQESIPLTYYGFAIFAVLTNLCFSYSKIIENEKDKKYIKFEGERLFFSTLGFLIGSLLNYISISLSKFLDLHQVGKILSHVCVLIGEAFFTFSFFLGAMAVHSLLDYLFERLTIKK